MMESRYFAGAHTARGYEHFLREIAPEKSRICIVRGPAGTGRHLLIARLADAWKAAGRKVTRFLDPEDAGRLAAAVSGDCAVLDGAAPHRVEALPGEMLIDLSAALDRHTLDDCREETAALQHRLRSLRLRTGRCLRAADAAREDAAAIYAEAVDAGSVCNLRLDLSRWLKGAPGSRHRAFAQAVTAEGIADLSDSLCREQHRALRLPWGYDPNSLLAPLTVGLQAANTGYIAAMQMLDGRRLSHLYTDTHSLSSETAETEWDLKFDQSLLRREQQALRFDQAAWELALHQAAEALTEARKVRDSLERLAADALDREKQEEMMERAMGYFHTDP